MAMPQLRWTGVAIVLIAFGLSSCNPTDLRWPFRSKIPTGLGCEVLDQIATDKLVNEGVGPPSDRSPRDLSYEARAVELHQRLQRGARAPAAADAEIKIAQFGGLDGLSRSTIASRANGVWTTSTVSETLSDPYRRQIKQGGALSSALGARLDRILSGGCVWKTPVVLAEIPLKNGTTTGICMDGLSTFYDIRQGQQRWRGSQYCGDHGAPGEIAVIFGPTLGDRGENGLTNDRLLTVLNRTTGSNRLTLPMPLALLPYGMVVLWGALFALAIRRYRWRGLWALAALPLVPIGWLAILFTVHSAWWSWATGVKWHL